MLNQLARDIRFDNASKGFDPTEGGVNRYILLAISELCEAQDEIRDGHGINEIYYLHPEDLHKTISKESNEGWKPCGFSVEIADAIIRILDISGKFEHDLENGEVVMAVDFEDAPIDDWLLGIVNIISDTFNYDPTHNDFWYALKQGIGTLFIFCEKHNIMIMDVVHEKLRYNRSRPPKHGRKF